MKAGRELDALVVENVMGWETLHRPKLNAWWIDGIDENGNKYLKQFSPSTNIADAWQVVTKLSEKYGVSVYEDEGAPCECKLYHWSEKPIINVEAKTVPLAICIAALKAVAVEIDD